MLFIPCLPYACSFIIHLILYFLLCTMFPPLCLFDIYLYLCSYVFFHFLLSLYSRIISGLVGKNNDNHSMLLIYCVKLCHRSIITPVSLVISYKTVHLLSTSLPSTAISHLLLSACFHLCRSNSMTEPLISEFLCYFIYVCVCDDLHLI